MRLSALGAPARKIPPRLPVTAPLRLTMRIALFLLIAAILPGSSADEKRIAIYATSTTYSLPITDRNGAEYVGLLEAIEPLGTVTSRNGSDHWKFRYNNADAEFTVGSKRAKIRGHDIDLSGIF